MKIYVVMVQDKETEQGWAACDWVGDDPYELRVQEVFYNKEAALLVFENVNKYGTDYKVELHEFDVFN